MNTRFMAVMGALTLGAVLAQPASADRLGQHPAVLVMQKWQTRGIDPNTFIVLHPAGSTWADTSLTATENATSDTAALAVRTASASNK
jgi:hypothetical protein